MDPPITCFRPHTPLGLRKLVMTQKQGHLSSSALATESNATEVSLLSVSSLKSEISIKSVLCFTEEPLLTGSECKGSSSKPECLIMSI